MRSLPEDPDRPYGVVMHEPPMRVVDWNELRAMGPGVSLPADALTVIPEALFAEVATSSSIEPHKAARKLASILKAGDAAERVCIGRYWGELSRAEATPSTVLETRHCVNEELTRDFRKFIVALDTDALAERILQIGRGIGNEDHERRRCEFVRRCDSWTAWVLEKHPGWLTAMGNDVEEQLAWIQQPNAVVDLVAQDSPHFDTSKWRKSLGQFPDRLAAGRWARLFIWYSLARSISISRGASSLKAEHEFGNNWDDAHYAFLASYTRRLVTLDKGLKLAVKAVFPYVKVDEHL